MSGPPEGWGPLEGVRVTVARSELDGAVLVFVDTDFEPDGSDGGPGLRVLVNDAPGFTGVDGDERCTVCGAPLGGVDPHHPHEPGCPRAADPDAPACRCDATTHPGCCWMCAPPPD